MRRHLLAFYKVAKYRDNAPLKRKFCSESFLWLFCRPLWRTNATNEQGMVTLSPLASLIIIRLISQL